ncbi:selenoprotein Pb-like [Trichosurus vulpecula]|uniref:selenoprotein Pb-like n=1 Tax=Trichosurus vulpecula TaxID=9337 RepID=UPI00186ACAD4|nr:selenoprotein Pb-like [Trichosurus vulpecula]
MKIQQEPEEARSERGGRVKSPWQLLGMAATGTMAFRRVKALPAETLRARGDEGEEAPYTPLIRPSFLVRSIGNLQERLARVGTSGVRFVIVNEKSPLSQALHGELQLHAPPGIPVYSQQGPGPDIWSILGGAKDDFLVYDRCGRLTFHLQLPFSFLHFPYVESAIRFTHRQDHCGNCSFYPAQVNSTNEGKAEAPTQFPRPEGEGQEPLVEGPSTHRPTLWSSTPHPAHTRGPIHSHGKRPLPRLPLPSLERPANEEATG